MNKLYPEWKLHFPHARPGVINYPNFLRILGTIWTKAYALKKEKEKISKRRKYKILNHDKVLWDKASEYFRG